MANSPRPRPFWQGLNPDKPEPLDRVLAALHCYQVAPPPFDPFTSFTFTVDRADHYRIVDGFPELRELAAAIKTDISFEFDPSTGKLTTMCTKEVADDLNLEVYHVFCNGLESLKRLAGPEGLLARELVLRTNRDGYVGCLNVCNAGAIKSPTLIFALRVNDTEPGGCAPLFAKYPSLRTVVVVQLALPTEMKTERQAQRLAEKSTISVIAKVNGTFRAVAPPEPLSTLGGGIKLWLSDFAPQDHVAGLANDLVRPLCKADDRPANLSIPYATILSHLYRWRRESDTCPLQPCHGLTYDGAHASIGNQTKTGVGGSTTGGILGSVGGSGKRPMSTLASSLSLAGHHAGAGINTQGGGQFLSGRAITPQHPSEPAMFRPRFRLARVVHPAEAVIAPWSRLMARLPRKW